MYLGTPESVATQRAAENQAKQHRRLRRASIATMSLSLLGAIGTIMFMVLGPKLEDQSAKASSFMLIVCLLLLGVSTYTFICSFVVPWLEGIKQKRDQLR